MPEYWPTNSSEKKMGKAITNTIMMKGIRKAPARRGRRIYSILFGGGGFIKICPVEGRRDGEMLIKGGS